MKRITIAILFGLVAGAICATGAFYGGILKFTPVTLVWVLLNRAVMGFAIGRIDLLLFPFHESGSGNASAGQLLCQWDIRVDDRVLHDSCFQAAGACACAGNGTSRIGLGL
jgi:hypothetical protein